MLKTAPELLTDLGEAIRVRRVAQNWSQIEAAKRAGMAKSTWQRLETYGQATTENLVNAAIALRCEEGLARLFPAPTANSMDELLQQQKKKTASAAKQRKRAPPKNKEW
ncbi:MAG: helix-turn-helix transcriptional regulator [Phycisphaerales bacterium]|nr:helix-turn-helix transcriptional regulator [Hyphomonadaceae bacterium]